MRVFWIVATGFAVVLSGTRPVNAADTEFGLGAELSVGAGHGTALFRLVPELPPGVGNEDSFWQARPALDLEVRLPSSHQLGIHYAALFRDFNASPNGWLHGHRLAGEVDLEWSEDLSVRGDIWGAFEAASAVVGNDYQSAGGGLAARWQTNRHLEISLGVRAQWFQSSHLASTLAGPELVASWTSPMIFCEAGGRWLTDAAGWNQTSVRLSAAKRIGVFEVNAGLGLGWVNTGTWMSVEASPGFSVSESWNVFAQAQGSYEWYSTSELPIWAHYGGIALRYTWHNSAAPIDQFVQGLQTRSAEGAALAGNAPGRITLLVEANKAIEVAVVGDFNGWDPTRLVPAGPSLWKIELQLPPARYAYQLVVDGALCTPVEASAYAEDGFGGTNAVLFVTREAAQETVHCRTPGQPIR